MAVLVAFFAVGATLLMQVRVPRSRQSSAVMPAKAGIQ
jgi:hypothetical protein